jgi:hypothetical protein
MYAALSSAASAAAPPGEGAARLEGAGVLQLLQLEGHREGAQTGVELIRVDVHDWRQAGQDVAVRQNLETDDSTRQHL